METSVSDLSAQLPGPPAEAEPGIYVYSIIECAEPRTFGKQSIGGRGDDVYTVHYKDLATVVSRTPLVVYDPTRENVLAHEHVNEVIIEEGFTPVPMSFGTLFKTEKDIVEFLEDTYDALRDVLVKMKDKLEFGLRVNWAREEVLAEIERDDEGIRRLKEEISKSQQSSTYFARMQLGRMIDKAMVERSAEFVREIYDGLRSVCVASRDNKPIGDKMIMNAAFLIQREREADFDAAVNRIAKKFGDRLNFKYTGPWPPYNFVNIRLKLERGTSS